MADFVAKMTPETEKEEGTWEVHIDNSIGKNGRGAKILVKSPTRTRIKHVIHFEFTRTNNEAEYEAFMGSTKMEVAIGASKVKMYIDS